MIFRKKDDDESKPVPGQLVSDAGFVAHEQDFEAVKLGVDVFDPDLAAVVFGVEKGVVVRLPVGGVAVARGGRCRAGCIPSETRCYRRLCQRLETSR